MGNLSQLTYLALEKNSLSGSLGEWIRGLASLQHLLLESNYLTGSLPSSLGGLQQLVEVDLAQNKLSGSIAPSTGALSRLQRLYLSSNSLSGTIPVEIGYLTALIDLKLDNNELHGRIPCSIGQLGNLQYLHLYANHLSGNIPVEIGNLTSLLELEVQSNNLNGTLPVALGDLVMLDVLQLSDNFFTGSIPQEFTNLTLLTHLQLNSNELTGTIPSGIAKMQNMWFLYLYSNFLTGTIPQGLSTLHRVLYILFDHNLLTGSCENNFQNPILQGLTLSLNSLTGALPALVSVDTVLIELGYNSFTGPVPLKYGSFPTLIYLDVSYNFLSGVINNYFMNMWFYFLNDNFFSGTLPPLIYSMKRLKYFFLANNMLEGNITVNLNTLRDVNGSRLVQMDLSSNFFTGSLPEKFFNSSPALEVFAASKNCFSGTLPDTICKATNLNTLALDGLSTASRCKRLIWSSISQAYLLPDHAVHGTIPGCLFQMPHLQSLHLSGNNFKGKIELGNSSSHDDTALGDDLSELSLSHNHLSGSIPIALQRGSDQWQTLDLSFNKLRGRLWRSAAFNDSSVSLSLTINRLSGTIPSSYYAVEDLNILRGNIFACAVKNGAKDLPSSDPYESEYICGSDSLNSSLLVWTVIIAAMVAVYGYRNICKNEEQTSDSRRTVIDAVGTTFVTFFSSISFAGLSEQLPSLNQEPALISLHLLHHTLRASGCLVLMYMFIVAVPVYVALSYYYGSYEDAYAWRATIGYLSGQPATIALCVFFMFTILALHRIVKIIIKRVFAVCSSSRAGKEVLDMVLQTCFFPSIPEKNAQSSQHRSRTVCLLILVLMNAVIVISVNGLFVYTSLLLGSDSVVFLALTLSLFKLGWNSVVLYCIRRYLSYDSLETDFHAQEVISVYYSRLMIFNTIVAPCLGGMIANADCFLYTFVQPSEVSTSYRYTFVQCQNELNSRYRTILCTPMKRTREIVYDPPFSYSYQCSSAILREYAYVFVYKYLFLGIIYPLAIWAIAYYTRPSRGAGRCSSLVRKLLPAIYRETNEILDRLLLGRDVRSSDAVSCESDSDNNNTDSNRDRHTNISTGDGDSASSSYNSISSRTTGGAPSKQTCGIHNFFCHEEYAVRLAMMVVTLFTFGLAVPYLSVMIVFCIYTNTVLTQSAMRRIYVDVDREVAGMLQSGAMGNRERRAVAELWTKFLSDLRMESVVIWSSLRLALYPIPAVAVVFFSFFLFDVEGDSQGWVAGAGAASAMGCAAILLVYGWLGTRSQRMLAVGQRSSTRRDRKSSAAYSLHDRESTEVENVIIRDSSVTDIISTAATSAGDASSSSISSSSSRSSIVDAFRESMLALSRSRSARSVNMDVKEKDVELSEIDSSS
jgi:hypothetical protein